MLKNIAFVGQVNWKPLATSEQPQNTSLEDPNVMPAEWFPQLQLLLGFLESIKRTCGYYFHQRTPRQEDLIAMIPCKKKICNASSASLGTLPVGICWVFSTFVNDCQAVSRHCLRVATPRGISMHHPWMIYKLFRLIFFSIWKKELTQRHPKHVCSGLRNLNFAVGKTV